jgi:hypothetical protein
MQAAILGTRGQQSLRPLGLPKKTAQFLPHTRGMQPAILPGMGEDSLRPLGRGGLIMDANGPKKRGGSEFCTRARGAKAGIVSGFFPAVFPPYLPLPKH